MPEIADILNGPSDPQEVEFQQPSTFLQDAPTPSLAGSSSQPFKPTPISELPILLSSSTPNSPDSIQGMEKWRGKVAVVTGASSGIGKAACEALAAAGVHVIAVARRKDRLEELQKHMFEVLGVHPSLLLPVVCDVTKEAEVVTLPKIVEKRWPEKGGISILVNNAGMSRNDASIFEGSVESWVEMLSTNILGTCMVTRSVLQDMTRRGSYGHVINMVGLSGHRIPDGPQGGGFYCGTKSALKTITEGLRQEARGRGVPLRVTAISPGLVETEFFSVRAFGDANAASKATRQVEKALQPEDIARAMIWALCAPEHMEVNDIVVRPTSQML